MIAAVAFGIYIVLLVLSMVMNYRASKAYHQMRNDILESNAERNQLTRELIAITVVNNTLIQARYGGGPVYTSRGGQA